MEHWQERGEKGEWKGKGGLYPLSLSFYEASSRRCHFSGKRSEGGNSFMRRPKSARATQMNFQKIKFTVSLLKNDPNIFFVVVA